jgi:hypothetical protein
LCFSSWFCRSRMMRPCSICVAFAAVDVRTVVCAAVNRLHVRLAGHQATRATPVDRSPVSAATSVAFAEYRACAAACNNHAVLDLQATCAAQANWKLPQHLHEQICQRPILLSWSTGYLSLMHGPWPGSSQCLPLLSLRAPGHRPRRRQWRSW